MDQLQTAALDSQAAVPYLYGQDDVHGVNYCLDTVIFPHNIALGAANDPELTKEAGRITAMEAARCHMLWNFAPTVAVSCDPRWGRTYECYSSDPKIVKNLGRAYTEGLVEKNNSIVACSSSVRLIDAHGNIIGERHLSCSSKKIAVEGLFSSQLIHPASMIRRIVDGKVISYDETLRYAQDFGLWSSLPIGTLTNLNEILLLYRTTVTQITSLRRDEQIACARAVQLRNIERNGLLLCDNEKEVFDFLINGNDNLTVTQESIKILIYRIMDVFKGKVDKRLLFNFYWCCFT